MDIPVYLFTGLLESGKTTLIHEVAGEEGFLDPGITLLVQCEEGETSFDQEFLEQHEIVLINIEEQDELNSGFWRRCESDYNPAQIMIEYNGMCETETLFNSGMPENWLVGGIYSTVNGETAELYINNMRKMGVQDPRNYKAVSDQWTEKNLAALKKVLTEQQYIRYLKMIGKGKEYKKDKDGNYVLKKKKKS